MLSGIFFRMCGISLVEVKDIFYRYTGYLPKITHVSLEDYPDLIRRLLSVRPKITSRDDDLDFT